MFLISGNISIRAVEPSDAPLIFDWENDISVWRVSDTLSPYSLYQIEQFIQNSIDIFSNKQARFMIDFSDNEKKITIGTIDLYDFDPFNKRAGVGIFIENQFRKMGFANAALQLVEQYSFQILELHQLYCLIGADNHESKKLFESRNYQLAGTRKDWLYNKNTFTDQFHYQLINPNHT